MKYTHVEGRAYARGYQLGFVQGLVVAACAAGILFTLIL